MLHSAKPPTPVHAMTGAQLSVAEDGIQAEINDDQEMAEAFLRCVNPHPGAFYDSQLLVLFLAAS
jgi:hypothetical protein